MNKKAFLLVDSLVCLIITVSIATICFFTYKQLDKYDNTYKIYYEENSEKYKDLYKIIPECIKCQIEQADIEEDF